jgi:trk system potassium uptake protein TrkH
MLDLRPVGYVIGLLTTATGAAMLVPLAVDALSGDPNWMAFLECAVVTMVAGGLVAVACRNSMGRGLTLQQAFLMTTGVWVVLPLFGALPFMLGKPGATFTSAYFEAMSGVTTTGATVFVGLDLLPRGTNLWRGILQWMGGLGIIVVAMVFLPVMKVGGMQFFRSEAFDTLGKILPRAFDIAIGLVQVYVAMTVLCGVLYFAAGMNGFEATVHAMTTVATGGFSVSDLSFARYGPEVLLVSSAMMFAAGLPFIRYVQLAGGSFRPLWQDIQVRAYLRWTAYAVALILAYRAIVAGLPPGETFVEVVFNTVSIFSGTGFSTVSVEGWGNFPFTLLIIVGLIGACTASTGCSIKVFRYLILIEAIKVQIRRIHSPNRIVPLRYDGRPVGEDVINSVIVLFSAFIVTFGVLAILLSMTGLQVRTAFTAAWTSVANVGPAFGPEVGATGAMHNFPVAAKWLMIVGMLLGRLELIAVFVLFLPRLWRG